MTHDFSVRTDLITLCSQCGRSDGPIVRRLLCVQRPDAEAVIARKLRWSVLAASMEKQKPGPKGPRKKRREP